MPTWGFSKYPSLQNLQHLLHHSDTSISCDFLSGALQHQSTVRDEALSGLPGTVCLMDDILVHGTTQEEHDD